MSLAVSKRAARDKRHQRIRLTLSGKVERPRLAVFRSLNQIYAQVIDNSAGKTLAAASSLGRCAQVEGQQDRPRQVGRKLLAERAKDAGVKQVVFDRAGYRYHGRVRALADAAREAGLDF